MRQSVVRKLSCGMQLHSGAPMSDMEWHFWRLKASETQFVYVSSHNESFILRGICHAAGSLFQRRTRHLLVACSDNRFSNRTEAKSHSRSRRVRVIRMAFRLADVHWLWHRHGCASLVVDG